MYVARRDMEILCSKEVSGLKAEYREKFGEAFVCFSYADFQGTDNKLAAQIYLETLERAVRADKPYCVATRRYDEFGH